MIHLGRNDPCHCGSGKKYKKCHLDADQRSRAGFRQSLPDSDWASASATIEDLPKLLRRLASHGPARDRNEFGEVLSEMEPILEYLACQGEIEAAGAKLEEHRSEFEALVADEHRYLALVQSVFAEETFAPLRFAAADVQRAFDHVGYPATLLPDDRTLEILRAAILRAADKDRRMRLARSLLLHLPRFVATGRHLEAWLLQCSAQQTAEQHGESNPFLFEMFSYGYDAWAADKQAKDESLLRELGLNPDSLRSMSLDELDSWIESEGSDAAKSEALEAFFRENPHLREESIANLQSLERNATRLLERDDSRFLHLPNEDIHPWLTRFIERASQQGFLAGMVDGALTKESARNMFEELVLPLMSEMAESMFTRDRILQLIAALRKYRDERFAASDKTAAGYAMGAIHYLERGDRPGENTFLVFLCWVSLRSAIKAASEIGPAAD